MTNHSFEGRDRNPASALAKRRKRKASQELSSALERRDKGSPMGFESLSSEHFRLAVESSPAAMVVTGRDGAIQFANAETERMFGYAREELIGKSVDMLVPARLREVHAFLRQGFFADPSKRPMGAGRDLKAVRRDGSEFPVEIGLTPIETTAELVVLATILDITARREAENALTERAAELERANDRLAQFAYVASHDLQEPLRKIAAFSELLDKAIASCNGADITYANRVMRTSALRARDLVDDLLTYSRTVNDEQRLQVLDLREEVESALIDLSASINETNAKISLEIPALRFRADRLQFSRLMQNIVSNAIKYRKPGRAPKIGIAASLEGDRAIRLAIADEGIGIEEKFAQTIFEPFKRLHSKGQYPGTGIGLAICKSIVDRHGWRIAVKSQVGEGATFFVMIPALHENDSGSRSRTIV